MASRLQQIGGLNGEFFRMRPVICIMHRYEISKSVTKSSVSRAVRPSVLIVTQRSHASIGCGKGLNDGPRVVGARIVNVSTSRLAQL